MMKNDKGKRQSKNIRENQENNGENIQVENRRHRNTVKRDLETTGPRKQGGRSANNNRARQIHKRH